jgi:hypothetical protein
MTDNLSRRNALTFAAAAAALAAASAPANAYQGNMEHALGSLQEALGALQAATPNKGGHRERAMELIRGAIGQVEMGIDFANRHGGG